MMRRDHETVTRHHPQKTKVQVASAPLRCARRRVVLNCLDPVIKVQKVLRRGIAWDVRILIKKFTESISNPRDEFIKPD